MKNKLLFLLLFLIVRIQAHSQSVSVEGVWEGNFLLPGTTLKIQLHIQRDSVQNLRTTMTVPAQAISGMPLKKTVVDKDSVLFVIPPPVQARYKARLQGDSLTGKWVQNGQSFPLTVKRKVVLKRPQNPQKPYPYTEEEVVYTNPNDSIHYGATLTKPTGKGRFPVVILLTGSGQEDRDETLFGHKPFLIIADYLTRRGIAVLRIDDRGVGKTTGNVAQATTQDFAYDGLQAVRYMKSRADIDAKKIGLIGHSEGGMIASLMAAQNKDITCIVSLAGPGVSGKEVSISQTEISLKRTQLPAETIRKRMELHSKILDCVLLEPNKQKAAKAAFGIYKTWVKQYSQDTTLLRSVGISPENVEKITGEEAVFQAYGKLYSPWMRYFLKYDPTTVIPQVKCPTLALNGSKDTQVLADLNLNGFKRIARTSNLSIETHVFPGLNHFFQHAQTGYIEEVESIEETFAPEVLEFMYVWLQKKL